MSVGEDERLGVWGGEGAVFKSMFDGVTTK